MISLRPSTISSSSSGVTNPIFFPSRSTAPLIALRFSRSGFWRADYKLVRQRVEQQGISTGCNQQPTLDLLGRESAATVHELPRYKNPSYLEKPHEGMAEQTFQATRRCPQEEALAVEIEQLNRLQIPDPSKECCTRRSLGKTRECPRVYSTSPKQLVKRAADSLHAAESPKFGDKATSGLE